MFNCLMFNRVFFDRIVISVGCYWFGDIEFARLLTVTPYFYGLLRSDSFGPPFVYICLFPLNFSYYNAKVAKYDQNDIRSWTDAHGVHLGLPTKVVAQEHPQDQPRRYTLCPKSQKAWAKKEQYKKIQELFHKNAKICAETIFNNKADIHTPYPLRISWKHTGPACLGQSV